MPKKRSIEDILRQKLREPQIVYLLGAGASICAGLPGTIELTKQVKSSLKDESSCVFEEITQSLSVQMANPNIEDVLSELSNRLCCSDLTDDRRRRLQKASDEICHFINNVLRVDQSTEYHRQFVLRLVSRRRSEPSAKAPPVQIFTVNYDLLLELACEESNLVAVNGFEGIFRRRWNPESFDMDIGTATDHVQKARFDRSARHIRLCKLHGSLSWYKIDGGFCEEKPSPGDTRIPLIIYPSRRKYSESICPPFEGLFRRFGEIVDRSNLLVSIGYGFGDAHLDQYIFSALNNSLSLVVFSKEPIDLLASKSSHSSISLINEKQTIIDGMNRNEVVNLWDFKEFSSWLPALKEK